MKNILLENVFLRNRRKNILLNDHFGEQSGGHILLHGVNFEEQNLLKNVFFKEQNIDLFSFSEGQTREHFY